jgi:hypothetical protein
MADFRELSDVAHQFSRMAILDICTDFLSCGASVVGARVTWSKGYATKARTCKPRLRFPRHHRAVLTCLTIWTRLERACCTPPIARTAIG